MELQLKNLTKTYGQKAALSGFTYTFREGIYGILGANGAGQVRITTTILSGSYWKNHFLMAYRIYN